MFTKNNSGSDMITILLTSAFLTLPFIHYARDIAHSLRIIAKKTSPQ